MTEGIANRERERLVEAFPTLTLDRSVTPTTVTGTLWLDSGFGFSVDLRIPDAYPEGIPRLVVRPEEIPWLADRHVITGGVACLCVSSEYRLHWPRGSDLTDFLECFVIPYFARQAYYQSHGHWPRGQERSHGAAGIVESFQETLTELGSPNSATIERFLVMLASPGHPKGHDSCPCGSGNKIRKCHRRLVWTLRNRIDPHLAQNDLWMLRQSTDHPADTSGGPVATTGVDPYSAKTPSPPRLLGH